MRRLSPHWLTAALSLLVLLPGQCSLPEARAACSGYRFHHARQVSARRFDTNAALGKRAAQAEPRTKAGAIANGLVLQATAKPPEHVFGPQTATTNVKIFLLPYITPAHSLKTLVVQDAVNRVPVEH